MNIFNIEKIKFYFFLTYWRWLSSCIIFKMPKFLEKKIIETVIIISCFPIFEEYQKKRTQNKHKNIKLFFYNMQIVF